MAVMNAKKLSASIKSIKGAATKLRENIQEALVSCAFYAMKDRNTEPFNQLLDAVGSATRIKGLTMWAETFAPVLVKEGKFSLNKTAAKELAVASEEDFAEYEAEMRKINWWEVAPAEKAESIFDRSKYMDRVFKHLKEHNEGELADALRDAEIAYFAKKNAETYGA